MVAKYVSHFIFVILGSFSLTVFQNCGSFQPIIIRGVTVKPSNLNDCDKKLIQEFGSGFYDFFNRKFPSTTADKTSCSSCHSSKGTHTVLFADGDPLIAFEHFKKKDKNEFIERVKSGHPSVLNYNTSDAETEMKGLVDSWEIAEAQCLSGTTTTEVTANEIFDDRSPGGTPLINNPERCGILNDPLSPEIVTGAYNFERPADTTISWDLGETRPDLAGITIFVDIAPYLAIPPITVDINGENVTYTCPSRGGYLVGNVRISSEKEVYIKDIHILLNGDKHGSVFFLREKTIPAGSEMFPFSIEGASPTQYSLDQEAFSAEHSKWSLFIETIKKQ